MKRDMKIAACSRTKQCVEIRIEREEIRDELLKRTTYIALPMRSVHADKSSWYDDMILTIDEDMWVDSRLREAVDRIRGVLSAYMVGESCNFDEFGYLGFRLLLSTDAPYEVEQRVTRLVRESLVIYVLESWFHDRLPEKSQYLNGQYAEVMQLLRSCVHRRTYRIVRPLPVI